MSERSSRSNVSVLLVHIDRLDIFKIQYTSRGFELGCEDVKDGGGGAFCYALIKEVESLNNHNHNKASV